MKTIKEKTFDAVRIQRDIRKKISSETENMSYKEFLNYMEQKIKESGVKPVGQK